MKSNKVTTEVVTLQFDSRDLGTSLSVDYWKYTGVC